MSQENVEIIRRFVEALNGGGMAKAVTFFDARGILEEPPEQPGSVVARGRDEIVQRFSEFDAAWEEHRTEVEELRVIDDQRVFALTVEHFRGREGIGMSQPCGTIFTLRDGSIVRMQSFWDRATALQAAGLSE